MRRTDVTFIDSLTLAYTSENDGQGSVPQWRGIILLKTLDTLGEYSSIR